MSPDWCHRVRIARGHRENHRTGYLSRHHPRVVDRKCDAPLVRWRILGFVRSLQHPLIGVGLLMVFSDRMVPEVIQPFWAALQRGEFITGAAGGGESPRRQTRRIRPGRRWTATLRLSPQFPSAGRTAGNE